MPWPAFHVARPVGHHLACYQLNQVGNPSLDPYKYPLPLEIKIKHSTCSSPHVNVQFCRSSAGKALSGVKSRVEHSLKLQK
jgi:hypothetical protein